MASIKELRVRIKSVGSIKQITRAMEMVATTKLRRFQDRATSSRPYAQEIAGLVGRLAAVLGDGVADQPLFNPGGGERTLCLVVSSDRGLCGAYNANLFRMLEAWRREQPREVDYFVYGRKAAQYMGKRGYNIEKYITEPALEAMDYRNAAITARMLQNEFRSGKYHDVVLLYSAFESMAKYVPTMLPFLPVSGELVEGSAGADSGGDVILEPDAVAIFERLVPRYLETRVYNALLEALTSEYASRRFAMKNATDAASDMQKALQGVYNRKRQENITKELLDIVGGAEALK
jgi:F-type H+-transporting ATPase subunit gamma